MKSRFHIYIFVVVLTFLGISFQQQNTVPNQEIVLQFTDVEVTSSEAENAVAKVAKQLQSLGIETINVDAEENGKLIISYYSDVDVVSVKDILSKENSIALNLNSQNKDNSQFPSQENTITYNLDVYEIQSNNDIESNLNGSVVELNTISDQLLNPNLYSSAHIIDVSEKDNSVKVAFKVHTNIAIAIDNISYVIPEVRAGPIAHHIS